MQAATIERLTYIGDYCDCCTVRHKAKYQRVIQYWGLGSVAWEQRVQYLCGTHVKHPSLPWFLATTYSHQSAELRPAWEDIAGPITLIGAQG